MRTFVISVTQEDIDLGERSDLYHCPVARALQRATGRDDSLRRLGVDGQTIFGSVRGHPGFPTFTELPHEARKFVKDFDERRPVEPFEFEVSIADRFLRD